MFAMTVLQVFIAAMGVIGQILVARQDVRGYAAWIALHSQTHQLGLIAVPLMNTAVQAAALVAWMRKSPRQTASTQPVAEL
jgi:hypothetical protein